MQWCTVVFCFVFVISNVSSFNDERIIGGAPSPRGAFPFLPRLQFLKFSKKNSPTLEKGGECSSTIISKRHILTAAHCVLEMKNSENKTDILTVVRRKSIVLVDRPPREKSLFPLNINEYAIATRIYFHPNYNIYAKLGDIAVIEFPEDPQIETEPITLINNYQPKDGDYGVAAGYGRYRKKDGTLSYISPWLQNATVPIHSKKSCKFSKKLYNNICTGIWKRMASKGDSGGPLMINQNETFYQIGVVSWGNGAERKSSGSAHAIYTSLSVHCPWIEKVTKNEVKCQPLPKSTPPKSQTTFQATSKSTLTPFSSTQTTVPQNIQILTEFPTPQPLHADDNSCSCISVNAFVFAIIFISILF